MIGTTSKPTLARDVAVVLCVCVLGVTLALQGWRSRRVDNDLVEYIDAAHALLSHGRIPDHGVVTSLTSYAPPGLAWFGVPGAALLSDPRLLDVPGNVILQLGTLIGVFLLARSCFGVRCALLAVVLYGASERGLLFAGSMGPGVPGPRAHPFFYVWMTYWTCRWVALADARYLAAALLTWAAGMYVFMELAPAIFILPVVWAVYRPPVRVRPLAVVSALALLMWFPYLRFEAARGFADLRSQVLMERIPPADYASTLCVPTLRVRQWQDPAGVVVAREAQHRNPQTGFVMRGGRRVLAMSEGLVINFTGLVPGAGLVLFALVAGGLMILGIRQRAAPGAAAGSSAWPVTALAIGLLVCGALANEVVIGRALGPGVWLTTDVLSAIRTFQAMAVLTGIALLMRRFFARFLRSLASRVDAAPFDPRVLAIALVVPWLILVLLAEWGRQDRLMGIWPLQAIVLAFVCVMLSERWSGTNRLARRAGEWLIVGIVAANPLLVSRIDDWRHDGWSGTETVETEAADYLAALVRAEGRDRAVIGYRTFKDTPPSPPWKAVNDRWRYGEDFDVALEYRDGISNLNRCGEGFSAQDEYRIVAAYPLEPDYAYYFDVPPAGHFRLLKQFGPYQVFKQDK